MHRHLSILQYKFNISFLTQLHRECTYVVRYSDALFGGQNLKPGYHFEFYHHSYKLQLVALLPPNILRAYIRVL